MADTEEFLLGRNSVMEALKSGRSINKILIAKGERHGAVREIVGMARSKGLVVQEVEISKLDTMTGKAKHQGVLAMVAPVAYVELEEVMDKARNKNEPPLLVLLMK
jgi:23S rRNA (guanosine2251-2'-O)-methyltransferase